MNFDGSPDSAFAAHGATSLWQRFGSSATAVAIGPGDSIIVGGAEDVGPYYIGVGGHWGRISMTALYGILGGDSSASRLVSQGMAVEYFHSGYGHFFISSTPSEIARLDLALPFNSGLDGWQRTGYGFKVWTEPSQGLSPACRFFSNTSFAPKSSHFYTPYAAECAGLKNGAIWTSEGQRFWLQIPTGAEGRRTCPEQSAPFYRAYNNGQGGAPNHRYTDDLAVLGQMVSQGWTVEGEAETNVFACIPR